MLHDIIGTILSGSCTRRLQLILILPVGEPDIFYLLVCCLKIYRTIMLPVVLYGCETWPLTLREIHELRVFRTGC
jgi:hypothetical protein